MDWLWHSLALLLIVEGIGPLLFPNKWRAYLQQISAQSVASLRQIGAILVIAGLLLSWFLAV